MVYVPYALDSSTPDEFSRERIEGGLSPDDAAKIRRALEYVEPVYYGRRLDSGEEIYRHVVGMALITSALKLDSASRLASLLFLAYETCSGEEKKFIESAFGSDVTRLGSGLERLNSLRLAVTSLSPNIQEIRKQSEVLRKMVLAMSQDIRVIILRLASRTQTLRYYRDHPGPARDELARESLEIYAPLANRLGIWEIKWEIEDGCFHFLNPDAYRQIARRLNERRAGRERFIFDAMALFKKKCADVGIKAAISGRPKHIYSIWKKMQAKQIPFEEMYDLHAMRVIVKSVEDCYVVLDMAHQIWTPVAKAFDDYISKPKGNNYQSLHTVVIAENGRPLEVQIRTWEMHEEAEKGVAAHWRYKEGGGGSGENDTYAYKVALLRELLAWRKDVADTSNWDEEFKRAALDDTIYVLTPRGRVVDLPRGATPVDFAYHVHTLIGHRCRGAKADGALIALNTPLISGQVVEISTAKKGGPSRDWLNNQLGYLRTHRARQKVRQHFIALDRSRAVAEGRSFVQKELQREGAARFNIDELSKKLGFEDADAMFLAAGRNELGYGVIRQALSSSPAEAEPDPEFITRKSNALSRHDGILIVGMDKMLTQLAGCCKPAPGDEIRGYITQGKGISIHRVRCPNFIGMIRQNPKRAIDADWGKTPQAAVYAADIVVECVSRAGLLRDLMEVLAQESINVTAANALSRRESARLNVTLEGSDTGQLKRALQLISNIPFVRSARRV